MMRVVRGKAIIIPTMPNKEPHTDNESKITAGLSPVTFPIILGVNTRSSTTCIEMNTIAIPKRTEA